MHGLHLLQDLAVIMVVAGLVTVLCHRFRQPVVLGYILAGVIVGPHSLPYPRISDVATITTLSEIGVILLMFSLGQHFSLRKLAEVGATAVVGATLEIGVMLWLGYQIGQWFGWRPMDSVFLGAILSISSTTIIVKALEELGLLKERFATLIFGILIVEDILAIAMIALLSSVATSGTLQPAEIAATLGKLGVFLASLLVVGLLTVPRLLRYVARYRSNEMLLVAVLGLCFGVSLLAAELGYSVALGAFLIGAIVAEARESGRIETLIEPVRDMFSAVFFVAIGMLIDPQMLAQYWLPILVISLAVVLGKLFACSLGAFITGNDSRTSLRVGMGLSQIGEFSFIIAQLGLTLKVTSDFLYPIAVAVSALTTLSTPYLIRSSDGVASRLQRLAPASARSWLSLYQRWLSQLGGAQDPRRSAVRGILRKLVFQVALDMVLATGLLIAASAVARRPLPWFADLPAWTGGQSAACWALAMAVALPLLVHAFLKIRALAYVLAELGVGTAVGREDMPRVRGVLATMIWVGAVIAAGAWIVAVGLTILPPWPVLTVLVGAFAVTVALMWRRFNQLHARAQLSLRETLSQPAPETRPERALSSLLAGAQLETLEITRRSRAVNRLIRELQLRSQTGASVVGIERDGVSIVNPGPDDELMAGDRVLLIGTAQHLAAARELLGERAPGSSQRDLEALL